jgi:molecular chaperone HtpG
MADADPTALTQTFGFQAEVAKLLHMMVHSVYSEREVFLRELVSNAADAIDRRRYEGQTNPALLHDGEPGITIEANAAARTLVIHDTGIGMTRQDLIDNLGTIARSGTQRFVQAAKDGQGGSAPELIGQFGVGFYAAFMVADTVQVVSRHAGESEAWAWASDGLGAFTLTPADRDAAGTTITLHLKEDAAEYLEKPRLTHILKTYSDHIPVAVALSVDGAMAEPVTSGQALWTRPKSEITADDYASFYRTVGTAWDKPLRTLHFRAEGKLEYTALLFTPETPPFDLYDPARPSHARLYVKRVFITDECATLLPPYLRFLRGVVDAQDLALNISREMLQSNPVLAAMRKAITGRVLSDYAKMAEAEPEAFTTLWERYGRVLKEGLYEDGERHTELLKLARFRSTAVEGWTSLADYVSRMQDGQEAIFVLAADTPNPSSPQLEGFKAKGLEVLLLTDPVDDFWLGMVEDFEGKPFKSITKADAAEGLDKAETSDEQQAALARLIAVMKGALGDAVKDIRPSARLTSSPACLVADETDMDLRLARMLKAHDRLGGGAAAPRVLELNPTHPLVAVMAERSGQPGSLDALTLASHLLLDQARILEGEALPDPAGFAGRLNSVLEAFARG